MGEIKIHPGRVAYISPMTISAPIISLGKSTITQALTHEGIVGTGEAAGCSDIPGHPKVKLSCW